ncbi:glycosyltransferase family 4 protein [Taibaiella helva]|uniref:glycosyltransferase family 4 protein n=1 Tax=Taibaiella helva TaxID=2301235 RepID=UPI0018E54351|nr:glycosyltransferase family 4 protein [Taibaiella helva]
MESGIKILHVVSISFSLPYFIGDQFDYFRKQGVQFYVASSPSPHFSKYAAEKHFVPLEVNILRSISPLKDLKAVWQLSKEIRKNNIRTVIGHTPKGGLIAMLAAKLAGVKATVYFRHGIMYETSTGLKRALLKSIERLTGALASRVVCVSESIKRISEEEHLSARDKNVILASGSCNGIDARGHFNPVHTDLLLIHNMRKELRIAEDDFVVGFVGRLVRDKGIQELVQAWKQLRSKHRNIKLLLVGPLEERDSLDEQTKQDILTDPTIIFTGLVEDARNFYALMNAFILPSYREGFPTVVLEASAMALPVIATKVTGCIDAVKADETGMFCRHDPDDIAEKIRLLYENREQARELGIRGREWVLADFEQEKVWKDIERLICGLHDDR